MKLTIENIKKKNVLENVKENISESIMCGFGKRG